MDLFNDWEEVYYKGDGVDIWFKIDKICCWINFDGCMNMFFGEVYIFLFEDFVNGVICFLYFVLYMGYEVEGVMLYVKDGYVEKWEVIWGKDFLD